MTLGEPVNRLVKLALLTGALLLVSVPAYAQDASETVESLALNALVLFLMVATVLVFVMHVGFAMLEAGLTRQKNAANIVGKNLMTITLGIVTYYAVGWGLMYGTQIGGFVGTDMFFLIGGTYEPDALLEIDFAFQAMFAATAATIVSGAVAERMKFGAYLVVAVVMTALIYPVVGAWTWGGGFLDQLGFTDFAGSTIVHLTGGVGALAGAAILGPRIGKYDPETGRPRAIPGHSMPLAAFGVLFLFFGWFGFNGGSVLALDGQAIAGVLVTTALAASGGAITSALVTRLRNGKYDVAMIGNGILAGLVGITAGADVVSNGAALLVGLVAGLVVTYSVSAFDRIRVDDPVGAVSVHGTCGVLGTLWVGLFHVDEGLFTGGGASLLGVQVVGVLAVVAWVGFTAAVLFGALKAIGQLRADRDWELEGLDLHEHGVPGYPELVFGAGARVSGAAAPPRQPLGTTDSHQKGTS
jgi:ammonium transporter, Amt family